MRPRSRGCAIASSAASSSASTRRAVVGAGVERLPNTAAVAFAGASGEALLIRLDLEGVAVSVGSACSSGTLAPSPALLALGLSREEAKSVVRFSLSRETTDAEIARVLDLLPAVVEDVRAASARAGGALAGARGSPAVIVECDQCHAKFQYDESRFGDKAAKKLRCSRCRAIFEVVNTRAFEAQPAMRPKLPPDETREPALRAPAPRAAAPAGREARAASRTSSSRWPSSPGPTRGACS